MSLIPDCKYLDRPLLDELAAALRRLADGHSMADEAVARAALARYDAERVSVSVSTNR